VAEGLAGEPGSPRRPPRLRGDASPEAALLWGVACILTVLAAWYAITVPIPRRVPPREGPLKMPAMGGKAVRSAAKKGAWKSF
jgi:hypothetical protein